MNRTALVALILLLAAASPTTATAQKEKAAQSLSLSSVELRLGENEQSTIKKLSAYYAVKVANVMPDGAKDLGRNPISHFSEDLEITSYILLKKRSTVVGVITFHGGRLIAAYRDWTPDDSSSYAFAIALNGALDAIKDDAPCAISSGSVQEPNYVSKSIEVVCGNKSVEVETTEASALDAKTSVTIYEWLSDSLTRAVVSDKSPKSPR